MIRVLGVMTGTSCDGLDASLLEFQQEKWDILHEQSLRYPSGLRKSVHMVQDKKARLTLFDWMALEGKLSGWYADSIQRVLADIRGRGLPTVDAIANHGQTVLHQPNTLGLSYQMGNPAVLAERTGLTCISHFRDGDLAAGGQGAPLVPVFHRSLADKLFPNERPLAIHNLGGISNLTFVGEELVAFDTGPCNSWIDAATLRATSGRSKVDVGGKLASQGDVDLRAVEKILKRSYFKKKPPKSTGRDEFPPALLFSCTRAKKSDLIATATECVVESIARAYENLVPATPSRVILCGGGARNQHLLLRLSQRLPEIRWETLDSKKLNPQMIEAQAFAYLGYLSLLGLPLGGQWTGARKFGPPGWITPGRNWPTLLERLSPLHQREIQRSSTPIPRLGAPGAFQSP